jgi:hypothetical protein
LGLGKRGSPYDSIARHGVFADAEMERRADAALTALGCPISDMHEAIEHVSRLGLVGTEHQRIEGLKDKANEWATDSEEYVKTLRLLKLRVWAREVKRAMRDGLAAKSLAYKPLIDDDGATTIRHEAGLSFAKMIPDDLHIMQTVSGTNWHHSSYLKKDPPKAPTERAQWFATARIADFFVVSKSFVLKEPEDRAVSQVGLMRQNGGLLLVDSEDLACSRYWNDLSDHFPVACYLALDASEADSIRSVLCRPAALESRCGWAWLEEDIVAHWFWRMLDFVRRRRRLEELSGAVRLVEEKAWERWIQNFDTVRTDHAVVLAIELDARQVREAAQRLRSELSDVWGEHTSPVPLPFDEEEMRDAADLQEVDLALEENQFPYKQLPSARQSALDVELHDVLSVWQLRSDDFGFAHGAELLEAEVEGPESLPLSWMVDDDDPSSRMVDDDDPPSRMTDDDEDEESPDGDVESSDKELPPITEFCCRACKRLIKAGEPFNEVGCSSCSMPLPVHPDCVDGNIVCTICEVD